MKVTFDFAAQKISLEGDGPELLELLQAARTVAPALSHISINTVPTRGAAAIPGGEQQKTIGVQSQNGANLTAPLTGQTVKQFVRTLALVNASERIAAIAYYMKNHESRETFAPKEMDNWFSISALAKPSQMPVAFFDAKKHHGYIESVGHGKWKLTTNGENLVVGKLNRAEETG